MRSRTFHSDRAAGLRLAFPPNWQIVPADPEDDLQKWLTTAAYPPPSRKARKACRERNDADDWSHAEQALWDEAIRGGSAEVTAAERTSGTHDIDDGLGALDDRFDGRLDDRPDDGFDQGFNDGIDNGFDDETDDDFAAFVNDLYHYFAFYVGVWQGLPEDPPGEDELLGCADWLAEWFMKPWEWFVPDDVHGLDHSIRKTTVSGRPAAAVWYRYLADETSRTAAYLRLLLIRHPDGRTSFVLGVAQSDSDRVLVDACLDSVEPLTAGPAG